MNWLDVIIIVSLVVAGFSGWRTGVVRAVVMFGGIVVGVVLAGQVGGRVGEGLSLLGSPGSSRLLGFAVVFGVCLVGAYILGILARKVLSALLLGWVDSLGGLVAGVVTSGLVWTALIIAAGSSSLPWATDAVQRSTLAQRLADRGGVVLAMLPHKYRDGLSWVGTVEEPTVQVVRATLTEAPTNTARLEGVLLLNNPNRFGGTVQQVAFELHWRDGASWRPAGGGTRKTLPIGAGQKSELGLPLEVQRQDGLEAARFLEALSTEQAIQVRLEGVATVSFPSETVEVSFRGEVPLQRKR